MPTVKLNKKVFEELVGKTLELEELKDRVSMLGTDLESIDGNEITVEVFPNRPDMLSEQGFARAFSSFIGEKTGLRSYDVKKSGHQVIVDKNVIMRPYTMCAIIKNMTFTDEKIREVMQIQEKLAKTHGRNRVKSAYGFYPSDTITFPIHYVAKDPHGLQFWPLGFDKPIDASLVGELHPKGKEYQHIAKDWTLHPFFIDANDNLLCMLPYTNSHDTGKVELDTKNVFIECTGMDLENVQTALNIFVSMCADMGGEIYSIEMVYPDKTIDSIDLTPKTMPLALMEVNDRLGLSLTNDEVAELLSRMGHEYENGIVHYPAYRADIMHQVDFIEDIAIAYGYENFVEKIPNVSTVAKEDSFQLFCTRVSHILVGLGLIETKTYHLTNQEATNTAMQTSIPVIELENSCSQEYSCLRPWIFPSVMQVLSQNKHHELPHQLFDIGTVFKEDKNQETGIKEDIRVTVVLSDTSVAYTKARQILDYLLRMLNVPYRITATEHPSFIPGRVGRVCIDDTKVAFIGELHPQVLSNWDIENPVVGFELNLTEIFRILQQ